MPKHKNKNPISIDKQREACESKEHYKTKGEAKTARARLQEQYGCRYEVYPCPNCGEFHIATSRSSGKAKRNVKQTIRKRRHSRTASAPNFVEP